MVEQGHNGPRGYALTHVNDRLNPFHGIDFLELGELAHSRHRSIITAVDRSALAAAMPRFFVHIRSNGHCWSYDEFGLDFPDVETARSQTLRAAHDLIDVFAARGEDPRDHAVEIENEAGEVVWHLPFSEIFLRDP
jgi:hypothetical protein